MSVLGRRIIYVDNKAGNDRNTGALSYRTLSQGPKATLDAAIELADDNTTIAVLPTGKVYTTGESILKTTKTINVMPLGDVWVESKK